MKSKSTSYKQYHSEVDDILSKLHSNNLQGNPITPVVTIFILILFFPKFMLGFILTIIAFFLGVTW
jgi:hypothetical protein